MDYFKWILVLSIVFIGIYNVTEGKGHSYWVYQKEKAIQADKDFEETYGENDGDSYAEFITNNPEPSHFCKWYDTK